MLVAVTLPLLLACLQSVPSADTPPALRRLTHTVNAYACFSPDGKSLIYQSNAAGNFDLCLIHPDGSGGKVLVDDPADDGWPKWSPDGKRIAFSSGPPDENQCVYLMNADGTGRVKLTEPAPGNDFCYDTQATFSSDGRWLAFTSYRPFGDYESSEICMLDLERVKR